MQVQPDMVCHQDAERAIETSDFSPRSSATTILLSPSMISPPKLITFFPISLFLLALAYECPFSFL